MQANPGIEGVRRTRRTGWAAAGAGIALALAVGWPTAFAGQGEVKGRVLKLSGFPEGKIKFAGDLRHLGSEAFTPFDVAEAEIHLFGRIDGDRVERLYWVQFERYRDDNAFTYDYGRSQRTTTIDGKPFHDDVWFTNLDEARKGWREGSDSQHVMQVLERGGWTLGPEVAGIRLVLVDESARRELMVVYLEDLRGAGLTAAALAEGGEHAGRWEGLSRELRRRALEGMKVSLK